MEHGTVNANLACARLLLAAIFLLSGAGKLLIRETAADIAALGLPFPALDAIAAGALELVCGVLLVLGLKTGWAAGALLLFMVPATPLFEHPFRGAVGPWYGFLKNLAVMGGLLPVVLREGDAMRTDRAVMTAKGGST